MNLMSRKYRVFYYILPNKANPIKDFLESLSNREKAKIFRLFQAFELYGLVAIEPHTKKLAGTPLWEIRILGKDNIRIIYVAPQKEYILALHGFIKKTQKTPQRDINTALQRYNEWITR